MKRFPDWIGDLTNRARIAGPRACDDAKPFTLEAGAEVVRRLADYEARRRVSRGGVALRMGKSEDWLYTGVNECRESVLREVDKFLEAKQLRGQGRGQAAGGAGLAMTSVVERIFAGARWAQQCDCIVLATGPAGVGKTMAAQAICADTPGAIYISIRTMGQTALAVMEGIAAVLRLPMAKTRARLFASIEEVLRDTGRLIVVDEIHKLTGKRNDESIHALRDLFDATGCPMLWLGMPEIAAYIRAGNARGYERLDQVCSRIGLFLDLESAAAQDGGGDDGPGALRLATMEDVRRFLALRQVRITRDGETYLLALVNQVGAGGYRALGKLLQLATKLAGDGEITAEMLRSIQQTRLGVPAAQALESRIAARDARAVCA